MPNNLIILFLLILVAVPAVAQDEEGAGEVADTTEQATDAADAAETAADGAEEVDDSDLDEQTYEEDDDDFVPTEEIPADEPIPFPSNI